MFVFTGEISMFVFTGEISMFVFTRQPRDTDIIGHKEQNEYKQNKLHNTGN
jgi:hypothetical protein